MLNKFFNFVLVNNSGQTITFGTAGDIANINLKFTGIYVTPSTGLLAYAAPVEDDMQFDAGRSIATWVTPDTGGEKMDDGSLCHSAEFDNATTKYINALVQVEVTHNEGTAADGTFDLYYSSGDTTGELETDASGYLSAPANKLTFIGSLTWEPNAADHEIMRSPVFTI